MSSEPSRLIDPDSPGAPAEAVGRRGAAPDADYVVVARRYRPQSFDELVGQEHVARALSNAIATNRVGHAYLFTGARGVGKTSAARILAKALDCVHGPTATPCNQCDICASVAVGGDVDVLEIDGASNRGIDEIRQLRQNVGVRPSRARFKIYIIDEVHMLTPQAFNALLKTLEEPPEHVKFIFCTTEANKIPITILSRCQRFDFAGIRAVSIRERLAQIAEAEGVAAEPEALELLARRANGSMRDSQSLLEQLLSFGGDAIRAADVHALLGTAGDQRIAQLLGHLVARNARGALAELDSAVREGVDVGQLLEQLMSALRDAMTAALDCGPDALLYTSAENQPAVAAAGRSLGLTTILAILQILDQSLARMRYSAQSRILAEMALTRIATLANLETIGELVARLGEGDSDEPRRGERPAAPLASAAAPAGAQMPAGGPHAISSTSAGEIDAAKKKDRPAADPLPELASPESSDASPGARSPQNSDPPQAAPAKAASDAAREPDAAQARDRNHEPDGSRDDKAPDFSRSDRAAPSDRPGLAESAEDDDSHDAGEARELDPDLAWRTALGRLPEGMLIAHAQHAGTIATFAPNRLVVHFPRRYNFSKSFCEQPDRLAELRVAVSEVAGRAMMIDFVLDADSPQAPSDEGAARVAVGSRGWSAERAAHPVVEAIVEAFGASVTRVDPPAG